ncbi:MAG: hypothetical protein ABIV51_06595 [Saprospiraceae bacterium]
MKNVVYVTNMTEGILVVNEHGELEFGDSPVVGLWFPDMSTKLCDDDRATYACIQANFNKKNFDCIRLIVQV